MPILSIIIPIIIVIIHLHLIHIRQSLLSWSHLHSICQPYMYVYADRRTTASTKICQF